MLRKHRVVYLFLTALLVMGVIPFLADFSLEVRIAVNVVINLALVGVIRIAGQLFGEELRKAGEANRKKLAESKKVQPPKESEYIRFHENGYDVIKEEEHVEDEDLEHHDAMKPGL